ncbi:MAG: hypothetical protein IT461_08045 [Planctomycetes bacterium]|nr:hypothetical protein [Planctomycetota bacterium]
MNALDYLRIYSPYADEIGGVHWSPDGDAVLGGDGATLALAGEVALFLEGFSAQAEHIHFAHVLHAFRILRWGPVGAHDELRIACAAFKEARGQARNAGVLFAHATGGMPRLPGGVDAPDVCHRLRGVHTVPQAPSIRGLELLPTVAADEFERVLAESLQKYSFDELKHWFRHGRGPIREAAQAIVRETRIEEPRSLAGILETLLKRGRLSGAEPFLEQMISALTLPPRKMQADALPVGGYSGIATRGHPDQILPSEFAIDELEFLRRFAENELLYYRREQPRNQLREDMVVLIDQGVRTWGDVRLLLSAAALAFGEKAARKGIEFALAGTSNNGVLVNPVAVGVETVAELVEASDLSENPADALERLLESGSQSRPGHGPASAAEGVETALSAQDESRSRPLTRTALNDAERARDIVILTHPRSLKGDVELASRRAGPDTRVFAVTVDGEGNVELSELRHGAPVKLSAFKVDLAKGAASRAHLQTPLEGDYVPWTGSIEPLGFPFRFAAPHGPEQNEYGFSLAFDADGEWLFTASRGGLIHAYKLDGTQVEILPRGCWRHTPLERIESLVGVAGGVCAFGTIGEKLVALEFDLHKHKCTTHIFLEKASLTDPRIYAYDKSVHAVTAVSEKGPSVALDLSTGRLLHESFDDSPLERARHDAISRSHQPPRVGVVETDSNSAVFNPRGINQSNVQGEAEPPVAPYDIMYSRSRGQVSLDCTQQGQQKPLLDGSPFLQGASILEAQTVNGLWALKVLSKSVTKLHILRGSEAVHLHELDVPADRGNFLLHDSCKAALNVGEGLKVVELGAAGRALPLPKLAKCHNELFFEVGDYALSVYGGKFTHTLRWDHGKLEATHKIGRVAFTHAGRKSGAASADGHGIVVHAEHGRPPMLNLDAARFAKFAFAPCGLCFVSDVYGQLFVLTPDGACVAALFVYRATVAAWLPDGTRYGPSSLTGGSTTPDALGRIGRALQAAVKGGAGF